MPVRLTRGQKRRRTMQIFAQSRARRLVRDLYRAILGREPDPDGGRTYENLIREVGADRALPRILRAFLKSDEYRVRADTLAVSHVNEMLASQGHGLINGRPVNHLVPLGSFCLPGLIFRDNGLRRYSLPFDWIFSVPAMVRDCLADDFAAFLDRAQYVALPSSRGEAGAEHQFYREKYGVSPVFAHHDPTQDADYLHFVRCVGRFRQLLSSDDTKLFLVIGRPSQNLATEFPLLLEVLTAATANFVLVCVELLDPGEPGLCSLAQVAKAGDHALYRFTPSAFNQQGGFLPDKVDEWTLLRLVYRYQLALKGSPWREEGEGTEFVETAAEERRDIQKVEQAVP